MNEIHKTIKSFLEKYDLNKPDLVFIVAFSGGFDSMCLLNSLKKITKNKIVAIHLNHKWRGEESDRDEINCKNFCEKINVEFYSKKIDPNTPKTETAAREARYEFFENFAKKYENSVVFTAHNKNDNAETLIYRMCKGTGIKGICGICENRGIYYRPLLTVSREDIENYCIEHKLTPNIDRSNTDTKYKRNLIRAEILPGLNRINEGAVDKICSLADNANEACEILNEYINFIKEKITKDNKILTKKFLKLSNAVQRQFVYNILLENNIEYDKKTVLKILEFIRENSNLKSGKTCSLTTDLMIFANSEIMEIIKKSEEILPNFQITKEGIYKKNGIVIEFEKFTKPVKKFPKDEENIAYVNLSNLPRDIALEIRGRQNGDIIKPLGSDGTQKLKKYLNAKKIPNHEKEKMLFLASENEILWAIGYGISDKIKVTNMPTHRIKFYKK